MQKGWEWAAGGCNLEGVCTSLFYYKFSRMHCFFGVDFRDE